MVQKHFLRGTGFVENRSLAPLQKLLGSPNDRAASAKRMAEWIATNRGYRWVGLYEVTATDIGILACTGSTSPAFPRFPVSRGLCGAAVATKSTVNVGDVQEDPRWLTTFGSTRSEIIVPVFTPDSRVVGLLDVESDALNAFDRADETFLADCAAAIAPLF
jgi:L-methionine (R)-S-oxide reductase